MTIYESTNAKLVGRHRKDNKVPKRIKVVIHTMAFYDAMPDDPNVKKALGDNPTAAHLAEFDMKMFQNFELDWDDLFDRTDVEFIGIEED
jgi:hypothetical protein